MRLSEQTATKREAEGTARAVLQDFYAASSRAAAGWPYFFFSLSFLERAAAAAANFRPFPRPFFFSSHHPKATCLGGFARERHPASPSPPDAYLGLDFLLGQSHFSNPGAATSVPADIGRLRAHPIRLPLGYSTRLVLQSSLKIRYNRQVHKVFDGDS